MAEIFKAGEPQRDKVINLDIDPSRQLSAFEKKMLKVSQEADKIISDAHLKADEVISKARAEADGIRNKAYSEGIEKGKTESLSKIESLAQSLHKEIETANRTHFDLVNKAQSSIIDFTFKLARLIIGSEIARDPSLVEKHLQRVLERVTVNGTIEIYVSEKDYQTIHTFLNETGYNMGNGGYELKLDPGLEPGGVRVNTPLMGVDGSIDGMFQRVNGVIKNIFEDDE